MNYLLIRSNADSEYGDVLGRKYEYTSNVPNHKKLESNCHVVVDRKVGQQRFLIGYGELGPPEETAVDEDGMRTIESPFLTWHQPDEPVLITQHLKTLIEGSPRYNIQHAIRPILQSTYDTLVSYIETGEEPSPEPIGDLNIPLNRILYGPPGTGKTYITREMAVEIADNGWFLREQANQNASRFRKRLVARYDDLVSEGKIAFTTFHQSFAYEDFVEGIRAKTDEESGQLRYDIEAGIFRELVQRAIDDPQHNNYVLIIDEINRGNISRIFGELITLLEPSKRLGAADSQQALLPYSKKSLSVPDNLYVIGTMNTADKSLAQMDIALRRRFTFVEMAPQPRLLDGKVIHGVSLSEMLATINERIEVLLDRDHLVGHSYFLPLLEIDSPEASETALASIFKHAIIPLLQEYFFDDWERIGWVFNDDNKAEENRFVRRGGSTLLSDLFHSSVQQDLVDRRYWINDAAFNLSESYVGIL